MTDNTIDLSNLKAELTPYSSVVGTSIGLVKQGRPNRGLADGERS